MPNKVDIKDEDDRFCDEMLVKVSRSFAAVIRQLPRGLCMDILIFYLALRALDTIEDDMTTFKGKHALHRTKLCHSSYCITHFSQLSTLCFSVCTHDVLNCNQLFSHCSKHIVLFSSTLFSTKIVFLLCSFTLSSHFICISTQ